MKSHPAKRIAMGIFLVLLYYALGRMVEMATYLRMLPDHGFFAEGLWVIFWPVHWLKSWMYNNGW